MTRPRLTDRRKKSWTAIVLLWGVVMEAAAPPPVTVEAEPIGGRADRPMAGAVTSLWRREMVRFFRQRNRVMSALLTPIIFWLMLGAGLNNTFIAGGAPGQAEAAAAATHPGYMAYFFPGVLVMIILFTAIFSTITVIEDRREGFLQGVLVSPAPRLAIVLGKVLGGASIATIQAGVFLLLWPLVDGWHGAATAATMAAAVLIMFILALGLTGLGLCIAWPMDSTAGFHAIMMIFLMPMWVLCGAVFPVATAPTAMQVVMYANPLTYGYTLLAAVLGGAQSASLQAPLWLAVPITLASVAGVLWLAAALARRPRRDGT